MVVNPLGTATVDEYTISCEIFGWGAGSYVGLKVVQLWGICWNHVLKCFWRALLLFGSDGLG